jgi:hypothetical protein
MRHFPIAIAAFVLVEALSAQSKPPQAVPQDAISAILDAFKTHSVVGLGEAHAHWQIEHFRESLIRDPRFQEAVQIIVVESGSARFQDTIDRFTNGEDIPAETLRGVWQNAAKVFEQPMYEQFFRTVRAVNASLHPERRLRVLLGEDPTHLDRDRFVADLIRREVLAKQKRALVTYGNAHFLRHDPIADGRKGAFYTMSMDLERAGEARVFGIWANTCTELSKLQPDVSHWPIPSLALIRGTVLGRADYAYFHSFGGWRLTADGQPVIVNGRPVIDPPRPGLRMEDLYDGVLYLGPPSQMTFSDSPEKCVRDSR